MTNTYLPTTPPASASGVFLVDETTGLPYTASGGGGGGGAVTIADGADVTQGAVADTAYATGSGSVIAILKGIFAKVSAFLLAQGSATSGQTGPLMQAAVTTTVPSYTATQTSPLSQNISGQLRTITTLGTSTGVSIAQSFTSATTAPNGAIGAAGTFLSTLPQMTNGQAVGLTLTPQGAQRVSSGGQTSALNVAATVANIKATAGRIYTAVLVHAGATDTTILDSASSTVTAATTMLIIPTATVAGAIFKLDFPFNTALSVNLGTGAILSIAYD